MKKTLFGPLLPAVMATVLLSACATQHDRTANLSPDQIYAKARDEMSSNNYEKAVPLFERLEGRAAGSTLAQQAQLDKAYALYLDGKRTEAIATLDRFLLLHPTSEAADYALYLKGIINFNQDTSIFSWLQTRDLSDRDPSAAKASFAAFKELVERFPHSRYAPDAHQRMVYIVNSLAAYDVRVARFYYDRGAYVAAINRAQQAIEDYQSAPALGDALEVLEASYEKLGLTELAKDTNRIIQATYPNGKIPQMESLSPWWQFWR